MSSIYHNSESTDYRFPYGAVEQGVRVWLKADSDAEITLNVIYCSGKIREYYSEILKDGQGYISCDRRGVYVYYFSNPDGTRTEDFRITSYEPGLNVPEWFKQGIIYQIFPDRFAKAESEVEYKKNSFMYATEEDIPMYIRDKNGDIVRWDFYGGNFAGIQGKIDYLKKLGIDTFYLNPIFMSVSNHRYDTMDYMHADGLLGGDKEFDKLISSCGENEIKVILDGVFSHTGAQSPFFDVDGSFSQGKKPEEQGAYVSDKSKYRSWYTFKDDGTYECWWDTPALPNVHELEPSYLSYTVTGEDSVIRHWINKGAWGWRLDVADELPDEYIKEIRKASSEANPESVIMGEVWEDASFKESYGEIRDYFTEKELHTCTNYPFRNYILAFLSGVDSAYVTAAHFRKMKENYPRENFYSLVNMTGSHDVRRLYSCFKDISYDNATVLLKIYSLVQFTFPGVPLIYYGDEICMEGDTDPDNRRIFPWKTMNGHLDTLEWFSELSSMRRENSTFVDGNFEIYAYSDDILIIERADSQKVYVTAVGRYGLIKDEIIQHLDKKYGMYYNVIKEIENFAFVIVFSRQN